MAVESVSEFDLLFFFFPSIFSLSSPSYDPATFDCCQRRRDQPAQSHQPTRANASILTPASTNQPTNPQIYPPDDTCKEGTQRLLRGTHVTDDCSRKLNSLGSENSTLVPPFPFQLASYFFLAVQSSGLSSRDTVGGKVAKASMERSLLKPLSRPGLEPKPSRSAFILDSDGHQRELFFFLTFLPL